MKTPDGVEGLLGRGDGEVDILRSALRDLGQEFSGRRVDDAVKGRGEVRQVFVRGNGMTYSMKVPEEPSTHSPLMKRPVLILVVPLNEGLSNW